MQNITEKCSTPLTENTTLGIALSGSLLIVWLMETPMKDVHMHTHTTYDLAGMYERLSCMPHHSLQARRLISIPVM